MFWPQGCGNLLTLKARQTLSLTFRAAHHTFRNCASWVLLGRQCACRQKVGGEAAVPQFHGTSGWTCHTYTQE